MNQLVEVLLRAMQTVEETNEQLMDLAEKIQENTDFIKAGVREIMASSIECDHSTIDDSTIHELMKVLEKEGEIAASESTPKLKGVKIIALNPDDMSTTKAIEDVINDLFRKGE